MGTFGLWQFTCDVAATAEAYRRKAKGGSDTCSCNACRNFSAARVRVYPPEFIALLDSVGIEPRKDGEVYHNARLAPNQHDYGGWFHFVGELEKTRDFPVVSVRPGFTAWLRAASSPHLDTLDGYNLVEVEFHAENVPWVLDEPEPH